MNLQIPQLHSLKTRVTLFTLAIFLGSVWLLSFRFVGCLPVTADRSESTQA